MVFYCSDNCRRYCRFICFYFYRYFVIFYFVKFLNPLNAELNPICHLLALVGAQHIFHVSGVRVNVFGFLTKNVLSNENTSSLGMLLRVCRGYYRAKCF
jgi:hypothetical protein